jgi:hypothetical protein
LNDWQRNAKYSEKTYPNAALSITNPTCCPDANPGRRCGKSATNRLSYGTALVACYLKKNSVPRNRASCLWLPTAAARVRVRAAYGVRDGQSSRDFLNGKRSDSCQHLSFYSHFIVQRSVTDDAILYKQTSCSTSLKFTYVLIMIGSGNSVFVGTQ